MGFLFESHSEVNWNLIYIEIKLGQKTKETKVTWSFCPIIVQCGFDGWIRIFLKMTIWK
jgi:hypothetical protein